MPKFELELDEKGEFVGALPSEIDAIMKRVEAMAHGTGFRSGQGKAEEAAKKERDEAVKAERARLEAQMPLEREKWSGIEEDNKSLKAQLSDVMRESSRNLTKREEAHAEEITKRAAALEKRNAKIQALVAANLKALAAHHGARDESLPELEMILQHQIGYDDDMDPFIKDPTTGERATLHGKPLTIDAFVKAYLDSHPHHRKAAPGRGGDARRGASLSGGGAPASVDAARARIEGGDRSAAAINDLFQATRAKNASA